ncbi:MAG: c-type cytochrome, partial [Planctomycetota bacterium]
MSIEFDHTRAARNTKIWIIVGSLATMFFLGLEAWREHFAAEWRDHQRNYASLLPAEYQANFQVGLRQAFLPEIGRVDRCQSCHIGIEDPAMADQEQPLRSHSGDLLQTHPPEDFGCTICHQGQGRATWLPDGHGDISHWERPMLRGPLIYTSCGQCHVENTAFGELTEQFGGRVADAEIYEGDLSRNIPGARLLGRGKRLFVSLGCLGCHSYQGKGATRGRDLTHVGDKGVHGYDFSHLPAGAQRTPLAWLTEHFLDPGAISPGTVMPDMGVRRDEALALAAYMLSLRSQTVPSRFRAPSQVAKGRPASGRQLYDLFCVACHGRDLAGSYVPEIRTPSLSNEDFLSVASDDYLEAIIRHGRSGTNMPAWSADKAGLTDAQIQRIVAYIRSFAPDRADISSISSVRGDAAMGAAIYRGNCANCHGRKGEGGLGTALRSQGFLMMASDQMLARTIVEGRPNTGMPSWRNLSSQEVSDVLAHLRTWRGAGPDPAEIIAYVKSGAASQRIGKKIYRGNCADCHGRKGQGAVGPSLNSEAFLGIVNDEYLIHAICEGRPGTAMPAWTVLSVQDVGDLVVHLRSFAKVEYRKPVAPVTQGDPDNGSHLYAQACASCHGQQGSGGLGPQLANPVFLARATDGFLYQTIAHGRPGTPMLGFLRRGPGKQKGASGIVEYTATQIADLVAYLRSLRFR